MIRISSASLCQPNRSRTRVQISLYNNTAIINVIWRKGLAHAAIATNCELCIFSPIRCRANVGRIVGRHYEYCLTLSYSHSTTVLDEAQQKEAIINEQTTRTWLTYSCTWPCALVLSVVIDNVNVYRIFLTISPVRFFLVRSEWLISGISIHGLYFEMIKSDEQIFFFSRIIMICLTW